MRGKEIVRITRYGTTVERAPDKPEEPVKPRKTIQESISELIKLSKELRKYDTTRH